METKLVKLGDIISLNYGKSLTKKNRIPGDVPVYGSSGITDYHDKPLVDAPSLIIGRKGSIGSVFLSEVPFYPIDTTYFAKESDLNGLDLHFAYYFLKFLPLSEMNTDSAIPGLNRNNFYSLDVVIPDIKSQKIIAFLLDQISYKIKINQQINKNLLKLINNIYLREYFANPQVALADHVALSDLIQTKTKTFNPKKTSETLVNHFSMPAFDEDQYPIIDKVTSIKSNKNIVEPFSVLVSKMNPQVKRVWLPNISDKILNVASTEFLTFTADSAEMQAFIFAIVNNKSYKQFLMSNTTGSTNSRQRVLPRVAYSFEIAFNRIKAERLGELLVPFLEKIKLTKSEIQRLKKLRALLLPKLLSGSINLSSMEEAMKNA
ncbi:Type I restriction-modification system specificity subunit S [Lactiplantibacillus plantarum]|nr:Type I restriction-modification system specificity subunit S [Lactiplantibacillus plantarum]